MINIDQFFIVAIDYVHKNPITFTVLSGLFSGWLKILAARHPGIDDDKIRTLIKGWIFNRLQK